MAASVLATGNVGTLVLDGKIMKKKHVPVGMASSEAGLTVLTLLAAHVRCSVFCQHPCPPPAADPLQL